MASPFQEACPIDFVAMALASDQLMNAWAYAN
jgi:hypothetical protein